MEPFQLEEEPETIPRVYPVNRWMLAALSVSLVLPVALLIFVLYRALHADCS